MSNQGNIPREKAFATLPKMWAVVPEDGVLADVQATFKDQGEAEEWRRVESVMQKCDLCVVPVAAHLFLGEEESDNG